MPNASIPAELMGIPFLTEQQQRYLVELNTLPFFSGGITASILSNTKQWQEFIEHPTPEELQSPFEPATAKGKEQEPTPASNTTRRLVTLLLLKGLRPDRLTAGGSLFVGAVFGNGFLNLPELDLAMAVEKETNAGTPLLLCSTAGYDASYRVDALSSTLRRSCTSLAIGSAEGFDLADKAIAAAAKSGTWVLLKNIHLAPQWLVQLEKKFHGLEAKPSFRLFLTSEIHPLLPAALLRESRVFVFEPPPGVKANLLHTFSSIRYCIIGGRIFSSNYYHYYYLFIISARNAWREPLLSEEECISSWLGCML